MIKHLIVCLHFSAGLRTSKTAFQDLHTYAYVEYSKLCTTSLLLGRLPNNATIFFKAVGLPSPTVWDPDVEAIWKHVFSSRQTPHQSM